MITWMIKLWEYLTVLLLVVAPGLLSLSYKDFDALGKKSAYFANFRSQAQLSVNLGTEVWAAALLHDTTFLENVWKTKDHRILLLYQRQTKELAITPLA